MSLLARASHAAGTRLPVARASSSSNVSSNVRRYGSHSHAPGRETSRWRGQWSPAAEFRMPPGSKRPRTSERRPFDLARAAHDRRHAGFGARPGPRCQREQPNGRWRVGNRAKQTPRERCSAPRVNIGRQTAVLTVLGDHVNESALQVVFEGYLAGWAVEPSARFAVWYVFPPLSESQEKVATHVPRDCS
jgi:hypothetical protein